MSQYQLRIENLLSTEEFNGAVEAMLHEATARTIEQDGAHEGDLRETVRAYSGEFYARIADLIGFLANDLK